ncbi:MAG: nucleotide exchange factor GrpE [Planctomycetes bacterium]|nr:nucleotide exchange factor GrpE [Planctomycetota bacterium]
MSQKTPAPEPLPQEDASSGAGESTGAPEGAVALAAEIARLEGEVRQLKERLLQSHADLDNQAKRFGRERQVVRDEITARVAREMIEVLDNLDLVLQSLPEGERATPLAQGVALTRVVFLEKLRAFGIEPIEPLHQPFNPFHHEALFEEVRADVAPGTVVGEISRGYRMGAQLVRAAKVRVAKAPAGDGAADGGAAEAS